MTASDGVSEIRYTTDGTAPTADSPLYTEPFEVPPSRLSFVRAATFAVGCPQGEIVFAHFNPVASSVSVAQANCAIDNSGETKMVGYDAIPLPYDTAWEGDSSSSMELRVDGDLIATRTGAGDVAWTPEREGMTTLTLRTVNVAGGTQAEYSAQYDVVPRNVMITEGETPLNERYPGLCQWITNVIVDASVESLGKKADLNTGDWGIVDVDETGKTAAYQSNTIDHNGNTAMSMAVEGPLEWSFKWKVSSEGNFDWLRWSLDGVEKSKISGTGGGWQEVQCVIPEGEHTVCWTYTKDGSASSGDDCGWVAFDLPQSASALFEGCSGLTSVSMPYRFRKLFGDTLNGRPITYIATVQIVVDGEELTTIYVPCGSAIGALPSVQPGEGYSAAFYNADVGGVEIASEMVVNEDMTIYVRWIANEYQMTFDAAGGVVEGEDGHAGRVTLPVTYDSEYGELPTASCDGYVFLGWTLDGAEVTATNIVKTASDHVLTAKWGIQVGNGVWEATICDDPITLGAPLVPPNGEVVIPATIAGRPVAGITAEAFAENDAITGMAVRLAVEGVAEGLLPYVPLYVIVENDEQVIPDAIAANVRKVVFADGVTRIADNWFTCGAMGSSRPAGCPNLETFDIADSVVRIGTNVFEAACALEPSVQNGLKIYQGWCLGFAAAEGGPLVHVTMPDGVRGIAARAFEGEYDIETVAFPSTLRFVGAGAFKDCTGLEDIDLPEGVVAVDREAFRNCTYAQSLILPTTLEEIGAGAFANATSLAGVTVPEGVVDIGDVAFSNCWRMMSATIPASVTNVGAAVFADCRKLTGVTVPLGLGTMAELFPAAYTSIASVSVSDGHAGRVTLPMDVGMFAGCAAMTDLTLPEELGEISDGAFVGCAGMEAFDLPNSVTNIGARAFMGLSQLTAFEFPAGLVAIGESAFSGCSGITALTLPDGLASIGTWAFYGLPQLSRVDIPASVTEIGYGAFGGCERLRSVSLPGDVATVADIMPDAYQLITSAAVTARSEIAPYQIIDSLFEGCEALAVVELPASVTGIGARAFAGCTSLTDAGIPSGVTSLGEEVFVGCTNLSAVSLPMGLTVLSSRMFAGCASLNDVIVPEGVVTLGANVFDGCSALRTVAYVGNAPAYDAAAYVGVPASLVTKVVNGSTGWDGIVTSKALPEFWPVGTSNEITFWEPNRFIVDFVVDGEGAVVTQRVEQVTGTTYMLPADAVRRGAVFGGWWTAADDGGARVTASTQVVLTRPHTFYAHWTFNRYSVHFDANGGEGEMAPQGMTVATGAALAECGFSRTGYAFVGWATEPDGEVVYSDAAEVVDLAYAQNAAVTLYAVWEAHEWTLSDYIDAANLEPVNDETAEWTPDWTTFKVGGVSLRSGTIAAADVGERTLTTLTATVVGEGTGSFWWKVSCEEMDEEYGEWYDYAVFTIDGTEVSKIAGESGWELVEYVVSDAGPHVLAWTFTRDDYDDDETAYDNVAWLDGVVWTPKPVTVTFDAGGAVDGEAPEAVVKYAGYELALPGAGTLANGEYQFMGWTDGVETYTAGSTYVFPSADVMLTAVWELKLWTFGEAVDATQLLLTIGGDADWSVDTANGWTNGVSAKSGAITSGQSSWIETTVSGAGTLGFHWNVMGGIYRSNPFAYAKVEVDGVQQAQEYATDGWKNESLTIEGAGVHTVRWTYLRTSARLADGDCAWLDGLVWTPSEAADPIPAVAVDADASKVNAMVDEVGFADAAVKAAIGGSAEEYNAFKAWAGSVKGTGGDALAGEAAVVANAHAAAAYLLGAERLFENEPTVEIGELAVGERSSGTLAPTMTVAVTVKDGESAVAVSAAKVAAMFEATSDLGDWTGAAKLTPTVTTSGTDAGGKMTFTVVPGDGTASKAFLRIKR
ncbi:MAG: leucine-rich repeat protein [Kiritimatiellae bacterium]|nr:leucine-rich repeat protein [Kiritimatiellia bacterium]